MNVKYCNSMSCLCSFCSSISINNGGFSREISPLQSSPCLISRYAPVFHIIYRWLCNLYTSLPILIIQIYEFRSEIQIKICPAVNNHKLLVPCVRTSTFIQELVPEFYDNCDFLTNSLGIDFGTRQVISGRTNMDS